jgi:hypothetical protein
MLCLLVRVVCLVLPGLFCIDEVVSPIAQHPADNERSLPRIGQLMHAFGVLDQPEYEVSFAKREQMNFLAVVSSQLLLIEC